MLGDLRILDAGDELLLDTERVGAAGALRHDPPLLDRLRRRAAQAHVERGLLSLIGPAPRGGRGRRRARRAEHAHAAASRRASAVRLIATDLGVDVLCDADDADALRDALVDAGAVAVAEAAPRCLRVEARTPALRRRPRRHVIPQEAGLNERAVSFTKGCYVGQETVARLYYRGKPNRHLRGLRLSARRSRPARAARSASARSGTLDGSVVSPTLGPIAPRARAPRGRARRELGGRRRRRRTATVVELPFG